MTKEYILSEIRRTAAENDGKPLGRERFAAATGIKESDWQSKLWVRWSDAVREAGIQPNSFNTAISDDVLLSNLASLVSELDHFPVEGERRIRSRNDPSFPDSKTLRRLGNREALAARLLAFAQTHGMSRVAEICEAISTTSLSKPERAPAQQIEIGDVYLLKSGRHYKIGRSNAAGRRERELAIQLPDKATRVHTIRTDDPVGIEEYWHRRFGDRRKNGEWFELTAADVAVFRRRKTM